MKNLLMILLTIPCICFSQKKHDCDSGFTYMPTIGTSSLLIKADTCLPDSVCKRLWMEFHKNMCGEMGGGNMSLGKETKTFTPLSYDRDGVWDDITGCTYKETWRKMYKGKWVEISKIEFDLLALKNDKYYKHSVH